MPADRATARNILQASIQRTERPSLLCAVAGGAVALPLASVVAASSLGIGAAALPTPAKFRHPIVVRRLDRHVDVDAAADPARAMAEAVVLGEQLAGVYAGPKELAQMLVQLCRRIVPPFKSGRGPGRDHLPKNPTLDTDEPSADIGHLGNVVAIWWCALHPERHEIKASRLRFQNTNRGTDIQIMRQDAKNVSCLPVRYPRRRIVNGLRLIQGNERSRHCGIG